MNVGSASAPISLDPLKSANGGTQTYFQELAYEPLIDQDAEGNYIPGLAIEWGYVEGQHGKKFALSIREDAKFADGTAVTAEAVAASLNYFFGNATGPSSGSYKGLSAEATGDFSVLITAASPNPVIDNLLTPFNLGGNIISPAGLADPSKLVNETFGAGPYVYSAEESVTGDHYTYVPNEYFYDKSQIHFDKVVVKVIANSQSALQAVRTGQVDIFAGDSTVIDAAKEANLQVLSGFGAYNGVILTDWQGAVVPALGELDVRQALNYAVDREAVTTGVYGDNGTPTTQPNAPGWDSYDPELDKLYPYDPEKAKQLLAEAGYPDGFEFSVVYTSFQADTTKLVQAMAADFAKVGVTMNLVPVTDFGGLVTEMTSNKYSAIALSIGGQTHFANHGGFWSTDGALVNPQGIGVDGGYDEANAAYLNSTADTKDATARVVQKIVVDQGLMIPTTLIRTIWIASPDLDVEVGAGGRTNNIKEWTK